MTETTKRQMKFCILFAFLIPYLMCCKKIEPTAPVPSYNIRIETDAIKPYELRVEPTTGIGKLYMLRKDLTGKKVFLIKPEFNEPVTLYYTTGGMLQIRIFINDKQTVDVTHVGAGSSSFNLKAP